MALIEIKSSDEIRPEKLRRLTLFLDDFPKDEFYCLSNDPIHKEIGRIHCLPWQEGLGQIMGRD